MGSKQSSSVRLPKLAWQHWHEVPLPSSGRKSSHGKYKLFLNIITNEKIQQYSISFQSQDEFQQYVESFSWRQREQHIINTKYFQVLPSETFCGNRINAKVYLQHIPYRLSTINDIPIPENLYVIRSALDGFQKLVKLIGTFRPSEEMIGVDSDGRVKVWINNNFSKNYLYGPHYVEGISHPLGSIEITQQEMIWQIINLVQRNTSYQDSNIPRFSSHLGSWDQGIGFGMVKDEICNYSRRYGLNIPKYFVTMLRHMDEENNLSEVDRESSSVTHCDPLPLTAHNQVYFQDPNIDRSNGPITNQLIEGSVKGFNSFTQLEQQLIEIPRQIDTTGVSSLKISFNDMRNNQQKLTRNKTPGFPKVVFNYNLGQGHDGTKTPAQMYRPLPQINTPQFQLPLSRIAENRGFESVGVTRRLTYSDISGDYELDQQLAEDMVKYLS